MYNIKFTHDMREWLIEKIADSIVNLSDYNLMQLSNQIFGKLDFEDEDFVDLPLVKIGE